MFGLKKVNPNFVSMYNMMAMVNHVVFLVLYVNLIGKNFAQRMTNIKTNVIVANIMIYPFGCLMVNNQA
jgi:hypothetical protein